MFAYKLTRNNKEVKTREYKKICMDCIRPNPYQPRKTFAKEEIETLAESIKQYGLIQPITVRCVGEDNYELIAGERRFRAVRLLGQSEIDAFIIKTGNEQSAVMALLENLQRQDLHFFEEAIAIGDLIKEHNLTQEQVATKLGKKQSTIANKLRLLKLSSSVRERVVKYGLTERHARAILKLEDTTLALMTLDHIYEKNLNVKKTEEYIEEILKGTPKKPKYSRMFGDNRVYVNSVKAVYKSIVDTGAKADFEVTDYDEKIVMSIVIRK